MSLRPERPEGRKVADLERALYRGKYGNAEYIDLPSRTISYPLDQTGKTCASRFAMAGKSAAQIMRWMGHSALETTLRYAHLAPNRLETLADALTKYGTPPLRAVA